MRCYHHTTHTAAAGAEGPRRPQELSAHLEHGSFARFRRLTRPRRELAGLSLAAVRALAGADPVRAAGYLQVRDDLPASAYLGVPFVRRAWRLLQAVQADGGVFFTADPGGSPLPADAPRSLLLSRVSFDWALARKVGMDPRRAAVNLKLLILVLHAAGFLTATTTARTAATTGRSITGGSGPVRCSAEAEAALNADAVGVFYRTLFFRFFSVVPWNLLDDLPPVAMLQRYGLVLLRALVRPAGGSGEPGAVLAPVVCIVSRRRTSSDWCESAGRPDGTEWLDDEPVLRDLVAARFLRGVCRMLGLAAPAVWSDPVGGAAPAASAAPAVWSDPAGGAAPAAPATPAVTAPRATPSAPATPTASTTATAPATPTALTRCVVGTAPRNCFVATPFARRVLRWQV